MTIEVGMQPPGGDKHVVGHVVPGEIITFSDYATNPRSILAVFCLADNSGGEVYKFDKDGSYEDSVVRVITLDSLAAENRIAVLEPNLPYECNVTSRTSRAMHLVLTHILND